MLPNTIMTWLSHISWYSPLIPAPARSKLYREPRVLLAWDYQLSILCAGARGGAGKTSFVGLYWDQPLMWSGHRAMGWSPVSWCNDQQVPGNPPGQGLLWRVEIAPIMSNVWSLRPRLAVDVHFSRLIMSNVWRKHGQFTYVGGREKLSRDNIAIFIDLFGPRTPARHPCIASNLRHQ